MPNPLIRKLGHFEALSKPEKRAILDACADVRRLGPRQVIVQQGAEPRDAPLLLEGIACRYKILGDGGRQITDFVVPGDLCDGDLFLLEEMDHAIGTISACVLAHVDFRSLQAITQRHPGIARALRWATLVREATLREWIANIGRRPADKRVAHVLCELFVRLEAVAAKSDSLDAQISQNDLADATGLSAVHVNRILQRLRGQRLITVERQSIAVGDFEGLADLAEYDPSYLRSGGRARRLPG